MDLFFNFDLYKRGLARGIYDSLREAILDGRLAPNDRLPPTRDLSEHLGVSRYTVAMAYARLTAEGFLEGRVGAGTFVVPTKALSRSGGRHQPTSSMRVKRSVKLCRYRWTMMPLNRVST